MWQMLRQFVIRLSRHRDVLVTILIVFIVVSVGLVEYHAYVALVLKQISQHDYTVRVRRRHPLPVPITPKAPLSSLDAIEPLLHAFAETEPTPDGIYVKDLKRGVEASITPHQIFTSASLYKLFVAEAIFFRIDNSQINYTDQVPNLPDVTVGECLSRMLVYSDNDCGVALGTIVGWEAEDETLHDLGYRDTTLLKSDLRTSAADIATLFTQLYYGGSLSGPSRARFLDLLKQQQVNNRLPAGLPSGTVVAHKTGDLEGYVHDAGIVFGAKTDYLVVVLSGPWANPDDAPIVFTDFSKKLYDFFEK